MRNSVPVAKESQGNKRIYLKAVLSLSHRKLTRVKCRNLVWNMCYRNGGSENLHSKHRREHSLHSLAADVLMSCSEVLSIATVLEFRRHSSQQPLSWSPVSGTEGVFNLIMGRESTRVSGLIVYQPGDCFSEE